MRVLPERNNCAGMEPFMVIQMGIIADLRKDFSTRQGCANIEVLIVPWWERSNEVKANKNYRLSISRQKLNAPQRPGEVTS